MPRECDIPDQRVVCPNPVEPDMTEIGRKAGTSGARPDALHCGRHKVAESFADFDVTQCPIREEALCP